jgi:O-antigen/teichoic acid export membrane protein
MTEGINKNENTIKQISNIVISQAQIIVAISILPVMIFISIFYETQLSLSSGFIAIIFIRFILRAQYTVFAIPIMYLKKTKVFFYVNSLVLFFNIILNYYLIPKYHAYGAIIAFMIPYIIQIISIYIIQQKMIKIKWNLKKVLYYPLIIILITSILEYIKILYNINSYITSFIIIFIIFFFQIVLYYKEIKNFVNKKYKSISI